MPDFRFRARNPKGELVDGSVTAADRAEAISKVEQQGLVPIKVQVAEAVAVVKKQAAVELTSGTGAGGNGQSLAKKEAKTKAPESSSTPNAAVSTLSHSQQYLFSEQLAHLLGAGMTLDESLGILVKRLKHPKLQALSKALHQGLVDGRSLSQAMRDFPRIFSPLYVNMISAGEASGALPMILRRLTVHLSNVKGLRDRVQQALLYPAFLVVIGFGMVAVFMQTMVPQLMSFFKGTNSTLPAATRLLIDANDFATKWWWAVLLAIFGLFTLFRAFVRTEAGRLAWDKFKWNVPVFSRIPRFRYYAQLARTLGTLTENGVTLLRALELLEDIAGNEYIRQHMVGIRASVVDGATLSGALSGMGIVPEMFVDMMGVGEQTGKFSETMVMIADVYERELDKQVEVVSTLIPPMVMVVIAVVIGTVIYGILVAVFNLTTNLHGGR